MIFCLQKYKENDFENTIYYGNSVETYIYENPSPDFTNIFDSLCDTLNLPNKWRENFEKIKNSLKLKTHESLLSFLRQLERNSPA